MSDCSVYGQIGQEVFALSRPLFVVTDGDRAGLVGVAIAIVFAALLSLHRRSGHGLGNARALQVAVAKEVSAHQRSMGLQ